MIRAGLEDELREALGRLGNIRVKRMFGGGGVYCDGLMFAILVDDELYLKTREEDRASFLAEGAKPFIYGTKQGRTVVTSYYLRPDRLADDPTELYRWAERAVAASRHTAAAKAKANPRSNGSE